jgi:hypothetical protein
MEEDKKMLKVTKYPISSFVDTGLLVLVNSFLHVFGFALAYEKDEGKINEDKGLMILRVPYRGFSEKSMSDAYVKISKFMANWNKELLEEAKGETISNDFDTDSTHN